MALPSERNLHIFGYGSLIWRPDFPFRECLVGHIVGYQRRFFQGSTDHRGTPERPGRVVTLEAQPHENCGGLAYHVEPKIAAEVLRSLDEREKMGYERHSVTFYPRRTDQPPIEVLVYVASPENEEYLGPASIAEIAREIRSTSGESGTNLEYLIRLAQGLRSLDLHDDHVFELEAEVLKQEQEDSLV